MTPATISLLILVAAIGLFVWNRLPVGIVAIATSLGTAQAPASTRWIPRGPTAFGSRLLVELALRFERSTATD